MLCSNEEDATSIPGTTFLKHGAYRGYDGTIAGPADLIELYETVDDVTL